MKGIYPFSFTRKDEFIRNASSVLHLSVGFLCYIHCTSAVEKFVFLVIEYDIFTDPPCDFFHCDNTTFSSGNRWNYTKYTT